MGNLFPWAAAALKEERSERRSDRDRVDGDQGDGRRKSRPSSINSRRKSSTPSSPPGSPKLHKSSPSSSSRYDAGMTTDEVIYKMGDVLVASPAGEAVKRYFNEHDHAGETKLRHARCIVDQLMDGKHFSASEVVGWVLPELRDFMEGTEQSRGWKEKREAEERNEIEDMVKGKFLFGKSEIPQGQNKADCLGRIEEDICGYGWKGGEETGGLCSGKGEGAGEKKKKKFEF